MVVCTYTSGYATKAERGHLQDHFNQITGNKSIASLGQSILCSREQGEHECHDQITGDHLYAKSFTVQHVDVCMPHKCNRRVKNHAELLKMEAADPDSEEIFMDNFTTLKISVFMTLWPTMTGRVKTSQVGESTES